MALYAYNDNYSPRLRKAFFIYLIYYLFSCTTLLHAQENTGDKHNNQSSLSMWVNEGFVSISAKEASFKEVVKRLALGLGVDFEFLLKADRKLSIDFSNLPWDKALHRLSENYAYSTNESGTLIKLYFYPKGESSSFGEKNTDSALDMIHKSKDKQKSFVFEFDPLNGGNLHSE